MASLVLYFITARYRLNLVPLLAALGAAGLAPLWSDLKARGYGLAGATVLAALLFVGWPVTLRDLRAVDHYNASLQLIQAGRTNEAFALARDGLAIDPGSAALHHTMGALYFQRGMFREAVEAFARAAALDPAHPKAAFNLALSLARDGDPCGGREVLVRASLQRPLAESAQRLLADLTSACGPR
jgi:predicted Zn-dependent protease